MPKLLVKNKLLGRMHGHMMRKASMPWLLVKNLLLGRMHGHVTGEEGKHAKATGQEQTPGQNAWSRDEEGSMPKLLVNY